MSEITSAQLNQMLAKSTEQWMEVFCLGPHTSFKMIQVLIGITGITYRDYLRDPNLLGSLFNKDRVTDVSDRTPYFVTWGSATGRCTSFAIRVADDLETNYPDDPFDFEFYNMGPHRVARCKRTGILIDSESKTGASFMPEGATWSSRPNDRVGSWKYYKGKCIFDDDSRDVPAGNRRVRPISRETALGICLGDVAKKYVLVCLFRSISKTDQDSSWIAGYQGLVRWNVTRRRIEMTPDIEKRDVFSTITFLKQRDHPPPTEDELRDQPDVADTPKNLMRKRNRDCINNLQAFIETCGAESQWRADQINEFHQELWKAAMKVWGHPLWKS